MSISLAQLDVLVLDCQSTGASPAHGHLLEVAWCRSVSEGSADECGSPVDASVIESHLVALPDGARIPRRISALTGIREADLAGAAAPAYVWERLVAATSGASENAGARRPVVAHFARFERAFIAALRDEHGTGALPFEWICTHEIARRLLPGLPRRGLRAVSGYLGRVMTEDKRAADHVRATRGVWVDLAGLLAEEHGVTTLAELRAWMKTTEPARKGGREFAVAREKRLQLPDAPGVYRMLGRRGQVLYVGKATSLKTRVNSYFQKRRHASGRTPEMLTQVFDVETTETATALEAALCETDDIKRHAPPYNVSLRGRGGDVVFLASDLSGIAPAVSVLHREGPLPAGAGIESWSALASLVESPPSHIRVPAALIALGLPEETPLDVEIARDGIGLFAERFGVPSLRSWCGAGARSWRELQARIAEERAAAAEGEEDDDDEPEVLDVEDDEPREPWAPRDPEQVASLLEGSLRHGARMLRRARIMRRLSESTIVWSTSRDGDDAAWRRLSIEGAAIVDAADVPPKTQAPVPGRWLRSRDDRAAAFDVAAYDRLRILTTELRRLVKAEREISVRFAPDIVLDRAALARRLFWI